MSDLVVKQAVEEDLPSVLRLMQQLAIFEGYIAEFHVNFGYLKENLLMPDPAQQEFEVLAAKQEGVVMGILVFYTLPLTYDLKPWFLMKELIVDENQRSNGVGKALMEQLVNIAKKRGVSKIRWDVLKSNAKAKRFYESLGAESQDDWELYHMETKAKAISDS
jgi:ribosomal protein S18 acetylase RimI-like enzyme